MTLNYDVDNLFLESDERGFIIGESLLGTGVLSSAEGSWTDIKCDFTSVNLSRSVSVDQGMMFRPEAAVLNLTTVVDEWADGVYGKNVRLRYGDEILFVGAIKSVRVSDVPGDENEPVKSRISLVAMDKTELLNKFVWFNWSRPQETGAVRAAAAWPDVDTTGLTGAMAASVEASNPTALEVLQEVADAALARFYVDRNNTIMLDSTTPAEASTFFIETAPPEIYFNLAPDILAAGTTSQATAGTVEMGEGFEYAHTDVRQVVPAGTFVNPQFLTSTLVPVTPGKTYSAGITYKSMNLSLPVKFEILWRNAANNSSVRVDTAQATSADTDYPWLTLSSDSVVAPVGAAFARFAISQVGTGNAAEYLIADALTFNEGPYNGWFDIVNPGDPTPVYAEHINLEREEVLDNSVSSVVVTAKSDETKTATRTLEGAVITNEQRYTVDILTDTGSLNSWVASFPLRGYTQQQPTAMKVKFQDDILPLDLTDLVSVSLRGNDYECAIGSINYSISPLSGWSVDYGLLPGHLVRHESIVTPGPVTGLTGDGLTSTSVLLTWNAPSLTGSMSGYELRYAVGATPPATRNSGTRAAFLDASAKFYTHTGRTPQTDYAYSLWAITGTPGVESARASVATWTDPTVPSVPQSVTLTKLSATSLRINWAAPASGNYSGGYDVAWTGGASGNNTNVASTATSYTITGLPRNKNYSVSVEAKTPTFHSYHIGSGKVTVTGNTNETIPTAVRSLSAVNLGGRNFRITWTAPLTPGPDFDLYVIRYNRSSTPPSTPTSGTLLYFGPSMTYNADPPVPTGAWAFSVWAKTKGGLFSPIATDTIAVT